MKHEYRRRHVRMHTLTMDPVELLSRLVSIPSVNPEDTADEAITGEARLVEFLAEWLGGRGFQLQYDEQAPGRPNLIARRGPAPARRRIMLEAHTDTVSVGGMTIPPFDPQVRDGRLYGRGACDTKGPMAAALSAFDDETLDRLAAAGIELIFAAAMGEEKGNHGAQGLVDRRLVAADECIVLEPTELGIVHAHKGALWYRIDVAGVAAHGSNPDQGLSAIHGMMHIANQLKQEVNGRPGGPAHALLGRPTLNIGTIQGGRAVNIVPDQCGMEVDRRLLPDESADDILGYARRALEELRRAGGIVSYEIKVIKWGPPFHTSAESGLVRRLKEGAANAGVQAPTGGVGWYSDAGPLSGVCGEIAVFGPGSIKQAHTRDEYIELDSLRRGVEILRNYLRRSAGGLNA
jgi:acetylornithine deacetylase/succinyl-diaminopimelate desuccinylase family protein